MSKKLSTVAATGCAAMIALVACSAFAGGPSGRTLAVTCNGCHGTDGHSKGAAPSLAGRPASQLDKAMKDFKSGKRPSTIMDRIAKGYTVQEIAAMSKYYSSLK
jgi:cytochrome c553